MEIDIRHLEKVKEGILLYALVPNIEQSPLPHYITGDTEEEKQKKRDKWKEQIKISEAKEREINVLHLNKANLIQEGEE